MLADGMQPMECMVQSQRVAAECDHPNRKVVRVICADRRRIDFYLGRDAA